MEGVAPLAFACRARRFGPWLESMKNRAQFFMLSVLTANFRAVGAGVAKVRLQSR
jgi:hypothetical protein